MSSTHTPGPWLIHETQFSCTIQIGEAFVGAPYQPPHGRGRCDRQIADARLIAAAPDLLAACKAMVSAWESKGSLAWQPENNPTLLEGMKAALAKAEGGA